MKSLIGAIGIGYMTLGKGMAPFHVMDELKQTAQPKNLMSHIKRKNNDIIITIAKGFSFLSIW